VNKRSRILLIIIFVVTVALAGAAVYIGWRLSQEKEVTPEPGEAEPAGAEACGDITGYVQQGGGALSTTNFEGCNTSSDCIILTGKPSDPDCDWGDIVLEAYACDTDRSCGSGTCEDNLFERRNATGAGNQICLSSFVSRARAEGLCYLQLDIRANYGGSPAGNIIARVKNCQQTTTTPSTTPATTPSTTTPQTTTTTPVSTSTSTTTRTTTVPTAPPTGVLDDFNNKIPVAIVLIITGITIYVLNIGTKTLEPLINKVEYWMDPSPKEVKLKKRFENQTLNKIEKKLKK
jgi:hypothetical protein